ncbi:uncharacterized protein LOC113209508 [Frankliniella occidentalis]|uniref:Uncharacterized protein LOC113209508 n=1 Tax=Frankliniella occidentalis TaxID=133901 RepID=A0A9C6X6T5_FRAOC|nr:uncharacterized protein LOC113209508 [Frankliniella occidentalis]
MDTPSSTVDSRDSDSSDLSDDFVQNSKDTSGKKFHKLSSAQSSASPPDNPVFKCQFCSAAFSVRSNCTRHEGRCEHNKSKEAALFTCSTCGSTFNRRDNFNVHLKKCSSAKPNCSERKKPCLFKDCGLKFYHKITLIEHIKSSHQHVSIKPTVHKSFPTIQAFNVWKEKEEADTFSYFTARKGQKHSSDKHFYCQHDGSAKLHSSRKTSRCKNIGRIKVGHQCIAKIIARVKEGKVDVEYFPTHSHVCKKEDMFHQPLPDAMSRFIDEKLAERIPPSVVYDLTKERFLPKDSPNVQNIKASILTKKRILERGRKRRMARRLHKNDAKAVYLMVTQLLENDDCVLLYKPYGCKVVHGPPEIDNLPDSEKLFMFAFQTERQRQLMNRHCSKIVIVDETHGTNQYNYNLLTAMVVDDNRRGWPIAHLITSKVKNDGDTLQFFFSCLKSRLDNDVKISCVITDDDPSLINGMKAGIADDLIHLLCKWHVIKNLKDNLRKKSSSDLFETVLSEIKVLMNTENENEFLKLKDAFKKKYKDENNKSAKPFLDYMEKYYFKRCEKWAMCYRNFPHAEVNTTGHIESFHSRLKKTYLKRKVNKRLDDLIHILFDVEWEDHCTRTREANTGFSSRPQDIMERHQRGLLMEDDVIIEQVVNRVWEVKSASNSSQIYIVERHKESCTSDFCFCKCSKPECHGLCSHLFSCSCPDHHPLCKHIHKLQSFLTRGQPLTRVDEEDFYIFPDVKDDCSNNANLEDNCRSEPSSSETMWQTKIDRLQSNVAVLQQFLQDAQEKSINEYSLTHADAILADLVKALHLDNNQKELESVPAMDPVVSFAPNEKLKTQVSQIPSFKRPLSKRKRQEDPSVLRQKKKAAIEGLLSYSSSIPNVDDPDDDLVNLDHENETTENYKNFTLSSSYVSDPFDIVLRCGDDQISLIHLKSLELYLEPEEEKVYKRRDSIFHCGWLYSSIIDAFIFKLCLKFPAAFHVGSDLASRALKTSNASYFQRRVDEIQNKSILFLPANLSGNHWFILAIFIQEKEIQYYDPLQGPLSGDCLKLLIQTVSDLKVVFPSSGNWKVKPIRRPKQTDSHSCGPYICRFAAELIDPCFNLSVATPYEIRKFIYHVIVGNCLSRLNYFVEECGKCHVSYDNEDNNNQGDAWLACSSCNQWFHLKCVDVSQTFDTFICP